MTSAVEPRERVYAAVRLLTRFWIGFLFRDASVRNVERVPLRGPVLLCINHPNNLIDSLLVSVVLSRPVHYLASASIFRGAFLARFLARAGVIPVYRHQDDAGRADRPGQPGPADRNAEMFAACHQALRAGQVIAMYPEGTTHSEERIQRIKTGAARIALDYYQCGAGPYPASAHQLPLGPSEEDAPQPPLALIPVGLSFERRKAFRGRVLVAFGPAIPIEPYVIQYRDDPMKAVGALTTAIQAGMESLVVHVDRIDTSDLVRAVEALYRHDLIRTLRATRDLPAEAIDPFRLSRSIVEAVAHYRAHDPVYVERLWQRIQSYQAHLAAYGVRDRAVRTRMVTATEPRPVRTAAHALLGFPIFAYGAVANALPYLGPRWLARWMARKETDYATIRFLASVIAVPACWGLETWIVWRLTGAAGAIVFALSLPLSGIFAHRYWVGAGRLGSQVRFALFGLTQHQAASRLVAERAAIIAELEKARLDYVTAEWRHEMARVVPPPRSDPTREGMDR